IAIEEIPHDWSQHNMLVFEMYSPVATGSPFWLILPSEDPDQEGMDYFSLRLSLNWEGWQEFRLPYDEIGSTRNPIGWHHIESFRMHSAWSPDVTVDPEAVVYVDNIRLEHFDGVGPRMTDREFFDALDLRREGLGAVREAVEAGEIARAKSAWAEYLRQRREPRWNTMWYERPEPDPDAATGSADLAMQHRWRWQNDEFFLGEDIDWSQNQMTEGESATIEWNASLNRHGIFNELSLAYWRTGDDRYVAKLVELWTDWIEDAPLLLHASGNSPYHWAWETLNTAVRTSGSWPTSLFRTLDSPEWTDDALVMVTKSFAEHAAHLMKHPTHNNWLTAEATGLYYTGVLFPEFESAALWRETAVQRLYEQMDREVYPDGLEYELALGYGLWVLRNYASVLDFAQLNDLRSEIPADWLDRIESMYDYVLYASMPNGYVPGLNDSGNASRDQYMEKAAEYFSGREDFAWAAEGVGAPPLETSRAFDYSGHYVMRTGWDRDDLFLLMDAGPFGSGHQHEDKLTFVLYAHGRMHVVDAGNYMYDKSRWRRYVLSTRGHNTVRVDGLDQHRRGLRDTYVLNYPFEPIGNPWVTGEHFDFVQGTYEEGYGDENEMRVRHERSVLFVRPHYWIIVDRMTPEDDAEHSYESLFHLDADEAIVAEDLSVTSVTGEGESYLKILPLRTDGLGAEVVKGREEEPVQGWSYAMIDRRGATPTAVYSREGSGEQTMAYVLWPVAAGDEAPVTSVERLQTGEGVVAGEISLTDGSRHLFAFRDAPGVMRFGGYEAAAEVAFVEVAAEGAVGRSFVFGGNELRPVR
ncbi:MAG: alginate lyase family protein, partial [Armatimonadota bacterium]